MKSVTFSQVVSGRSRLLRYTATMRQGLLLGITLALGLPGIVIAFHQFDPDAPLPYIVLPVLAGGLVPVFAGLPSRFEVHTRFHARHLLGALDDALASLGYAKSVVGQASVRYRCRRAGWRLLAGHEVTVTVREHALEIVGPFATLAALQKRMSY
jgi:hypothetical protein